jgi:stearoyl-CoA desaturase (delta-9 desaturase)
MDLLTSARIWTGEDSAQQEIKASDASGMPWPQKLAMLASVITPFAGFIAAVILLWHRHHGPRIGWPEIIVFGVTYALTGFGVTVGFHRLLTHRAFVTSQPVRWIFAILGSAAGQGMVILWCATHRRHHQRSDSQGDPHSPHLHGQGLVNQLRGFWHAHVRWLFNRDELDLGRSIPDLVSDPVLMAIDRLYFLWIVIGMLVPAATLGFYYHSWTGFAEGLIWGGLVRIFLMQHVTWSVNSVCHIWGTRPFRTSDMSANNCLVSLVSLGEGWHNNHHAFPTSARHGVFWWEFDPSYLIIRILRAARLVWNVKTPSKEAIAVKLNRLSPCFPYFDSRSR